MLFLYHLLQVLSSTHAIRATPLPIEATVSDYALQSRNSPPPFECMKGFELTAYTSTGISTCTKIAGSSILPGYSGQTVAFVGLISGLTGLMMGCLPVAKYFYRSGTGYFRSTPNTWQNAFPRDAVIGNDSAIGSYPSDAMHQGWSHAFHEMQKESYDANATYVINNSAEQSTATILHNGMNITHNVVIVPHNSTHVTWDANTDITYNGAASPSTRRDAGWTGARVVVNNYPIDGVFHAFPITISQAKVIAQDIVSIYVANIFSSKGSQICAFLGSEHTVTAESYAAAATISSQENYGPFEASTCPAAWQAGIDQNDEL